MGASPQDVRYGPYFGETDREMVVATPEAVYRTTDGGKTWAIVVKTADMPAFIRYANFGELKPCFGWDWKHKILYATSQGVAAVKYKVEG
jgi:hypothetical protein